MKSIKTVILKSKCVRTKFETELYAEVYSPNRTSQTEYLKSLCTTNTLVSSQGTMVTEFIRNLNNQLHSVDCVPSSFRGQFERHNVI